jgi:hypothetical protein
VKKTSRVNLRINEEIKKALIASGYKLQKIFDDAVEKIIKIKIKIEVKNEK